MNRLVFLILVVIFAAMCISGTVPAYAQDNGGSNPVFCAPPAAPGDTKDKIKNTWGDPDIINSLGTDETGLKKEEWVYTTKPFSIFSKNEYVCMTQHLVFIGDNLVKITASKEAVKDEYGK